MGEWPTTCMPGSYGGSEPKQYVGLGGPDDARRTPSARPARTREVTAGMRKVRSFRLWRVHVHRRRRLWRKLVRFRIPVPRVVTIQIFEDEARTPCLSLCDCSAMLFDAIELPSIRSSEGLFWPRRALCLLPRVVQPEGVSEDQARMIGLGPNA